MSSKEILNRSMNQLKKQKNRHVWKCKILLLIIGEIRQCKSNTKKLILGSLKKMEHDEDKQQKLGKKRGHDNPS